MRYFTLAYFRSIITQAAPELGNAARSGPPIPHTEAVFCHGLPGACAVGIHGWKSALGETPGRRRPIATSWDAGS